MADVKTVRGTLHGAKVQTSEENAKRLGSDFKTEPQPKAPAKKAASQKSSKS
jgi:hypothetical protein